MPVIGQATPRSDFRRDECDESRSRPQRRGLCGLTVTAVPPNPRLQGRRRGGGGAGIGPDAAGRGLGRPGGGPGEAGIEPDALTRALLRAARSVTGGRVGVGDRGRVVLGQRAPGPRPSVTFRLCRLPAAPQPCRDGPPHSGPGPGTQFPPLGPGHAPRSAVGSPRGLATGAMPASGSLAHIIRQGVPGGRRRAARRGVGGYRRDGRPFAPISRRLPRAGGGAVA